MSLFDWIFRPNEAKKSDQAVNDAYTMFRTLTAYQPVFTNWGGAIYESEIVRAAIDARARHISKLKLSEQRIRHFSRSYDSLRISGRRGHSSSIGHRRYWTTQTTLLLFLSSMSE